MKIRMKRFVVLSLLVCLILSLGANPAEATDLQERDNTVLLSSLNDAQCRAILLEYGVSVPEELKNIDLPGLFRRIEKDPDREYSFGWVTLADFVEEVKTVVKAYYGLEATPTSRTAAYTLQYSEVHLWDPETMPNYNCYAYALGLTYRCQPGNFSNQQYDSTASVAELAGVIKDDLNGSLGFACVKTQSTCPYSAIGWPKVIAVRKDTTGDLDGVNDYHVARLSYYAWFHKPGQSAVLRFLDPPTNSVAWTDEHYNGAYYEPVVTYDSNIVYLLYKTSHGDAVSEWTGEHYHSGQMHYYQYAYRCPDCQDILETEWVGKECSGPPCLVSAEQLNDMAQQIGE